MINLRGRCDVVETVALLREFNDKKSQPMYLKKQLMLRQSSKGNLEEPAMQCVEGTEYLKGVCNARIREI